MAKAKKTENVEEIDPNAHTELERGEHTELRYCTIEELKNNIKNLRTGALPDIPELMGSIEQMGMMQPLNVREDDGGGYNIVDGFRRQQALVKLHEKHGDEWDVVDFANIPISISEGGNEVYILLQQATANLQRVDTAPEDLGTMCKTLMSPPHNMEIPQLSSYLGKKSDFVLDLVKYMDAADDDMKKLVRDGKVSFRQAVDSLELSDEQREDLKKLAKATKNKTEAKKKVKKAIDAASGKDGDTAKASKKGAKRQTDKLMVAKGILGDKEIFGTLKKEEVEQCKGFIACLEWSLGQRNTLPLPKKAEEIFLKKYEEQAKHESAKAEAEKLQAKAEKAKTKAAEQAKKAAEAAEAAAAAAKAAAA